MIKKEKHIVTHLDTDTAIDKRKPNVGLDINNLKVTNNKGLLSLTPIHKKEVISGSAHFDGVVIGHVEVDKVLYVIVQDIGIYAQLYKMELDGTLSRITKLNTEYSRDEVLDVVGNKENDNIVKLYWAGGQEQLCSINVLDPTLNEATYYDARNITPFEMEMPVILSVIEGGSLLAGKIQYAYSLFKLHGAETTISPLSLPVSIAYNGEGGKSGEVLNLAMEVALDLVDQRDYTYIRIYSIHYQELNQLPKITLIIEEEIVDRNVFFIDDGNLFIKEMGIDKFTFLGGTLLSPETIAAKNNRLFAANYTGTFFDVDWINDTGGESTDCRMYSHNGVHAFSLKEQGGAVTAYTNYDVPQKNDAINPDPSVYKYKSNGTTLGAEGPNFRLSFIQSQAIDKGKTKSLKQGETYRIGVVLYNIFSQKSPVKWMCDITIPRYSTLKNNIGISVAFIGDFGEWTSKGVHKFQIAIVQRKPRDRSVSAQGFIIPAVHYLDEDNTTPRTEFTYPNWVLKRIVNISSGVQGGDVTKNYTTDKDFASDTNITAHCRPKKQDKQQFFYSTDTIFDIENIQEYSHVNKNHVAVTDDQAAGGATVAIKYFEGDILHRDYHTGIVYNGEGAQHDVADPAIFYPEGASDSIVAFERTFFHRFEQTVEAETVGSVAIKEFTVFKEGGRGLLGATKMSLVTEFKRMTFKDETGPNKMSDINCNTPNCIGLEFDADDWAESPAETNNPWSDFKVSTDLPTAGAALPLLELYRILTNQYGGNSYETKSRNTYMLNGKMNTLTQSSTEYIGDVTIGPIIINSLDGLDNLTTYSWNIYEHIKIDYAENNVDVFARNDDTYLWFEDLDDLVYGTYRLADNHKLLTAYNQENTLIEAISRPITFDVVTNFDASIIASELKFPNEVVDSWTEFLPNEVMNLQGVYGSINKLYNFNNEIYSFQDSAVAHILIQPRIQIQTEQAVGVELGTGQVLHDYTYLNTKSGTISKRSVVDDGRVLLYYDNNTNTINTHEGEELTTSKFVKNLMDMNKPATHILKARRVSSVYVTKRNEFAFTIANNNLIIFNPLLQSFQRREVGGDYLMGFNGNLLSTEEFATTGQIWEHYKSVDKEISSITYTFAPEPDTDKVFHNIEYRSRGEIKITRIDVLGVSGLTGSSIDPLISEKFGIKRIHLPRVENSRDRFRDTGIRVTLTLEDLGAAPSYLDTMTIMYNIKG